MKGLVVFSTLALARPSSAFVAPRAIVGATGAERTENGVFLAETVVGASYEGPGKINSSIDLDSPKVVNNESVTCGKKGVYCRCWQSKTFPACDGSHMNHNEATGDNVGPLIVVAKAAVEDAETKREAVTDAGGSESVAFEKNPASIVASLWGMGGVLLILLDAFRRTLPGAMVPFRDGTFTPAQWLAYGAAVAVFTYGQGVKCLSCKLAPLVVKRSCLLTDYKKGQRTLINTLLAPVYAMGLISANKSRLIKSHSLVWGTTALQVALHRGWVLRNTGALLNIVNGGFCAGFGWGATSLAILSMKSILAGKTPEIDAGFSE
eukprot:CAMPEP_0185807192 /NCGR_PEP_ID=MMETSP1322-20130828/4871_1 /TAXON_ID=265543 /ORGANISM="Minutocellus polymorphus, Strain RCC2270" /LENGTH=320 /DNA_ID=CAMNT_0028503317 /DNA_START=44 /DNA_END=1006 /DNA_ORIENTATION=-